MATFSDPGFSFDTASTEESFTATIDWGDGTPVENGSIDVTQGTVGTPTTGTVTGAHTYHVPSQYTVTVTVMDDPITSRVSKRNLN